MHVRWLQPILTTCLLYLCATASPEAENSSGEQQEVEWQYVKIVDIGLPPIRANYLRLAAAGDFRGAADLALAAYPIADQDKLYLTELGLLHSYFGDHENAMKYCAQAYALDSEASLILSCMGLASIYLSRPADETIPILRQSIESFKREMNLVQVEVASAAEGTSLEGAQAATAAGVLASPFFTMKLPSLEFNLLVALKNHRRYRECIDWFITELQLPALSVGAVHILYLAVVKWSDASRPDFDALESRLRAQGKFAAPPGITLWDEVRRVQEATADSLSTAQDCLTGLGGDAIYTQALDAVLVDFMHVIQQRQRESEAAALVPRSSLLEPAGLTSRGVVLIQQYYAARDTGRTQDIHVSLWRNLQNDYITDIYLLNEESVSLRGFPNAHKIHQIVIGERLTFQRAFAFANEHLQGRTVILANADIFFDGTLFRLSGADDRRVPPLRETSTVFALLKWRLNTRDESLSIDLRTDSQDAWVFQPPVLPAEALAELDFYMGLPRCDNRLVHVLQQHNYTVLDPAFAVHAVELDSTERVTQIYNTEKSITGPTSTLLLSDQFEF